MKIFTLKIFRHVVVLLSYTRPKDSQNIPHVPSSVTSAYRYVTLEPGYDWNRESVRWPQLLLKDEPLKMCVNVSPALENVFAINDIIMKVYCPLGDMMMSHFEMIS